jgi:hypothetical protein
MPLFRHHVDYLGMNSEEICFIHVLNQMMYTSMDKRSYINKYTNVQQARKIHIAGGEKRGCRC